MESDTPQKDESSFKEYFSLGEVFTYFFRKKSKQKETNINLRMMHGVNKFSIIVFLLGMTFFIIKKIFFH